MWKPNICKKQNLAVCLMSLGKLGAPSFLGSETSGNSSVPSIRQCNITELDDYIPLIGG